MTERDDKEKQPVTVRKKKQKHIVIIDYIVPFPEIILMSELTSQLAITKLKAILALYSIPDKLVIQYATVWEWWISEVSEWILQYIIHVITIPHSPEVSSHGIYHTVWQANLSTRSTFISYDLQSNSYHNEWSKPRTTQYKDRLRHIYLH